MTPENETPEAEADVVPIRPDPNVVKLRHPVQFGKETIAELTLKPTARSFRDFALPMKSDGQSEGGTVMFQPYELARVGLHMAGQPTAVLDKLHPADLWEVANRVMGFLELGPLTGPGASR